MSKRVLAVLDRKQAVSAEGTGCVSVSQATSYGMALSFPLAV
jgi:hypothetical protein